METIKKSVNIRDFQFLGTNVNLEVYDPSDDSWKQSVSVCDSDGNITFDPYGKIVSDLFFDIDMNQYNPYFNIETISYNQIPLIHDEVNSFQYLMDYLCRVCHGLEYSSINDFVNQSDRYYYFDGDNLLNYSYYLLCDYQYDENGCPIYENNIYTPVAELRYRQWEPTSSFLNYVFTRLQSETDMPFNFQGTVIWIRVTDSQGGFTADPTVTISGGGGTGATAMAFLNDGKVTSIDVVDPGSGYTTAPDVTITGTGTANAIAIIVPADSIDLTINPTYNIPNIIIENTTDNGDNWMFNYIFSTNKITYITDYITNYIYNIIKNPYDIRPWQDYISTQIRNLILGYITDYYNENIICKIKNFPQKYEYNSTQSAGLYFNTILSHTGTDNGSLFMAVKEWEEGVEYRLNDVVLYNGNTYILKSVNSSTGTYPGYYCVNENAIYFDDANLDSNGYVTSLKMFNHGTTTSTSTFNNTVDFTHWKRNVSTPSTTTTLKVMSNLDSHLTQVRPYRCDSNIGNFFDPEPIYEIEKPLDVEYINNKCYASWIKNITYETALSSSGAINQIIVTSGGSGYSTTNTRVIISGDGTGAIATANIDPTSGEITSITMVNGGSGYTEALIRILGNGSGASAFLDVGHDTVTYNYILNAQVQGGNLTPPLVAVTGTGIEFTEIYHRYTISNNGGSGYTTPPTISIKDRTGYDAIASATIQGGVVTNVTINSEGNKYSDNPQITFSPPTNGTQAQGKAVVVNGKIKQIEVMSYYYNYNALSDIEYFTTNYNPLISSYAPTPYYYDGANPDTTNYSPLIKYEYLNGIMVKPKVLDGVDIDRGRADAFEFHISLREVGSVSEILKYRNGGLYKIKDNKNS